MSELSEREKQIARDAWGKGWREHKGYASLYAAIEAVKAEWERTPAASPAEPAPDLIEKMLNAYYAKPISGNTRQQMTAAYQIARQHCAEERDKQWEKALQETCRVYGIVDDYSDFLEFLRKRLSQPVERVETLEGKVQKILISHDFVEEGFPVTEKIAAEIIALVRAELEGK